LERDINLSQEEKKRQKKAKDNKFAQEINARLGFKLGMSPVELNAEVELNDINFTNL